MQSGYGFEITEAQWQSGELPLVPQAVYSAVYRQCRPSPKPWVLAQRRPAVRPRTPRRRARGPARSGSDPPLDDPDPDPPGRLAPHAHADELDRGDVVRSAA